MSDRPLSPAIPVDRRRFVLAGAGAAGLLALTGCGAGSSAPESAPTTPASGGSGQALAEDVRVLLARHGVEAATAEEAVEAVDRLPQERPLALQGQVTADEVRFADEEGEAVAPLTRGEFYLSLAPYRSVTHPCTLHALGGCQGELTDTDVHVKVTGEDGTVLVDADARTGANGFTGHWVPRGRTGTVEVTVDGQRAECPFDSGPDGGTCLTELRLA